MSMIPYIVFGIVTVVAWMPKKKNPLYRQCVDRVQDPQDGVMILRLMTIIGIILLATVYMVAGNK